MLIDVSEEHTLVRFTIGDFEEPYEIPNPMVDFFISQQDQTKSQQFIVWKASIECLRKLKAKYAVQGSRRREREGGREVEEYRREKLKSISELLDWLENNPEVAGLSTASALPIFTGTTVEQKLDLENDGDFVKPNVKVGWFNEDINLTGEDYYD